MFPKAKLFIRKQVVAFEKIQQSIFQYHFKDLGQNRQYSYRSEVVNIITLSFLIQGHYKILQSKKAMILVTFCAAFFSFVERITLILEFLFLTPHQLTLAAALFQRFIKFCQMSIIFSFVLVRFPSLCALIDLSCFHFCCVPICSNFKCLKKQFLSKLQIIVE